MNVITLTSVSKTFGIGDAQVKALDDSSLTVKKGEFVIIMGPSGSGKSTLMSILGLLDKADSGSYLFCGSDVTKAGRRERAKLRRNKVGFVFQSFNLLPRLTTLENVALPLTYRGIKHTKKLEQATDALAEVGLEDRQYYYPHELSGGQHQRAAIARAIVGSPDMILADEPTGNLDSGTSKLVMGMLKRFHNQGHTLVMVTHNTELLEYADRAIFMKDGKIESESNVDDLTKKDIDKVEKDQITAAHEEIGKNVKLRTRKKAAKSTTKKKPVKKTAKKPPATAKKKAAAAKKKSTKKASS